MFTGHNAFLDGSSVVPKWVGNTYLTEVFPFAANYQKIMSPIGPTNPPTLDDEWARLVEPEPSSRATPSSSSSNGNEGGLPLVTPEYGTNPSGITL